MNDLFNNINKDKITLLFSSGGKDYAINFQDIKDMRMVIADDSTTDYLYGRGQEPLRTLRGRNRSIKFEMMSEAMELIAFEDKNKMKFNDTREELEKLLRGDGV